MPVARQYNSGSVIYFEKEKADKVFVLKEGKVILRYISIEENFAEKTETITPGQFFGVKSAIANFPREETATAVVNCNVLILTVAEFEQLASKNIPVLMKMLKVFSNQLRNVHKHVRRYLTSDMTERKDIELFKIGDFYLRNKRFDEAVYVYTKYVEYYPDGEFAQECKEKIMNAKKGITMGLGNANPTVAEVKKNINATSEDNITKSYYEAVSLFSQNKFKESISLLSNILKTAPDDKNKEFIEKSHFQLGKCYLKMEDIENAKDKFTYFIKNFSSNSLIKEAMFNLGTVYEKLGETEQALTFYNKVLSIGTDDSITSKAKNKISDLERS